MEPKARQDVVKIIEEIAKQSPLDNEAVRHEKSLPGGILRRSSLRDQVSGKELREIKRWMRENGARQSDIHNLERKLGLRK